MNTCSKCGAELQAGARMCGKCGAEITPSARTVAGTPAAAGRLPHAESDDLELGQVQRFLASVYKVERVLGRGIRTVVYQAAEINPPRPVAVKVLPTGGGYAQAAARFKDEARAAMALNHPNIVPVYRVGLRAGAPYFIAMKLVEGRALDAILHSQGALPLPAILLVLRAATAALDYAHGQGTNHGDLKAGDILIDRDGRVMVSDFGIARTIREMTGAAAAARAGGADAGGVGGPPSDQYALGVVALQMLTGSVPSDADFLTSVRDVRSSREGLPDALVRLVQTALARDPGQRYASAADMLTAIKAIPFTDADRRDAYAVLGQLVRGEPVPRIRVAPLPPRAGVGLPGRTTSFKAPTAAATVPPPPAPTPRVVPPAPAEGVTKAVPAAHAARPAPAAAAPPAAHAPPPASAPPVRKAPPAPAHPAPPAARTPPPEPAAPAPPARTAPPAPAARTAPPAPARRVPPAEPTPPPEPPAPAPPPSRTGPFASVVRPAPRASGAPRAKRATPEPEPIETPGLWTASPEPPAPPPPAARPPRVTPQPWTDHGVLSTPPIPYPKRPSRAKPLLAAGLVVAAVAGGVYWLVSRGPAPSQLAQTPARAAAPAARTPATPGAPAAPAPTAPAVPESARSDTAHRLPAATSGARLDTTVATEKTGQLLLYAVPSTAEITVDDELSGSGGFVDSEVTAGRRHLHISAPGYAALDTIITVRGGSTLNLGRLALQAEAGQPAAPAPPTTGRIRLRTVPPTAEIFVDGQSVGVGALVDFEVTSGQRQLRISAPGFVTLDTLITVEPGATVRLGQVSLQSAPGGQ
ncbi:MAG TPA: protein kinase [Gemmatimonadales bacterium]|nr:protein kinase [Gemmatimonadales bacterium]